MLCTWGNFLADKPSHHNKVSFIEGEKLVYGGAVLVPLALPTSWRKCLSMNERLLFFRMVSSNIAIVWGLGAPGGRVLACNFM